MAKNKSTTQACGTRRGNGMGWGGPPRGAGNGAPPGPTFGSGNAAAAGYHNMSKSQRLAVLDELKFGIAMGIVESQSVQLRALESYEARHLGTPTQSVQHSGPDGGPIPTKVEYSWAEAPTPSESQPSE